MKVKDINKSGNPLMERPGKGNFILSQKINGAEIPLVKIKGRK